MLGGGDKYTVKATFQTAGQLVTGNEVHVGGKPVRASPFAHRRRFGLDPSDYLALLDFDGHEELAEMLGLETNVGRAAAL